MNADRAVTTSPKTRVLAGAGRTAFGCLALVALAVGYDRDLHTGDAVNFFFYFTDLSNLLGAGVLLAGDIAGRIVVRPAELQAGIVIALIGAPFFAALVWLGKFRQA